MPFTVNDPERMRALAKLGVDGLISDDPALLLELARSADPGLLLPDGRIDRDRFDAQGHRGARAVRPENTLPSMEAALDALVTTLDTNVGLTSDGALLIAHDFVLEARKCRRVHGAREGEPVITSRTLAELQRDFICDVKLPAFPKQQNELALSPVSVAYAKRAALAHPYTPPMLEQLFAFVDFYATHYETGEGRAHPDAARRAANAREVRFNVEAKVNPEPDFAAFSPDSAAIARVLIRSVKQHRLEQRVDIQSFDWSTLKRVQEQAPALRTSYLIGDYPLNEGPGGRARGEGNLYGEAGNTPWPAGLYWPYRGRQRGTFLRAYARAAGSRGWASRRMGRRSGLCWRSRSWARRDVSCSRTRSISGRGVTPGNAGDTRSRIGPRRWASSCFYGDSLGLAIERDDSQGDLGGFKVVHAFSYNGSTELLRKAALVDLLRLRNQIPGGSSIRKASGSVGLDDPFAFPFITIEAIAVLSPTRLAVINDNNYPFSVGRYVAEGEPDGSEVILIELPRSLPSGR